MLVNNGTYYVSRERGKEVEVLGDEIEKGKCTSKRKEQGIRSVLKSGYIGDWVEREEGRYAENIAI